MVSRLEKLRLEVTHLADPLVQRVEIETRTDDVSLLYKKRRKRCMFRLS